MGNDPKTIVETALQKFKELLPDAQKISFEEIDMNSQLGYPEGTIVVTFSYTDPSRLAGLNELFQRRSKSVFINGVSGELVSIKNKII